MDGRHGPRPVRLPVVLSPAEAQALLAQLRGVHLPMAGLLCGAGLCLMECLRLRVKDADFACRRILIRDGKGEKDRVTMLPERPRRPGQPERRRRPNGATPHGVRRPGGGALSPCAARCG